MMTIASPATCAPSTREKVKAEMAINIVEWSSSGDGAPAVRADARGV